MKGYIVAGLIGAGVFAYLSYRYGKAIARLQRAWRDLRATKDSIKGLWQRVRYELGLAIRYGSIALLAVAVVIGVLWVVAS